MNKEEKPLLVKNFMSPSLIFFDEDHTLDQAERIMQENRIVSAPVLIDKKRVLGVMTDFKLIKCFIARNAEPTRAKLKDYIDEFDPVVIIDENEPIATAFKLLIQSPNHRVFVSRKGVLVGVLAPRDILPFLAGDDAIERLSEARDLIEAKVQIRELSIELSNLKLQLSNYQQVFINSPFMMHSVDLSGTITMANRMIHYVLGYNDGELVGKSILDIYPSQYHQQAKAGLLRVKELGFHPLIHTLMVKKNTELVKVDIASASRVNDSGVFIGTITIGRVSDSNKMLEALVRAAEVIGNQNHESHAPEPEKK